MTSLASTRSALRTWADKQSPEIKKHASVIVTNLKLLKQAPDDGVLLQQTQDNVRRLERLIKTAEGTKR